MDKKKLITFIIISAILIAVVAGATIAYNVLKPPENVAMQTDDILTAPDFTFMDSEGNSVNFSDFIGKPIVLNIWASWCDPCEIEMPHFEKISEKYSDDELQIIMLNFTGSRGETVESARKFIEDSGYTFPVYYDNKQEGVIAYGVDSIPLTVFIDKNGNISTGYMGTISEDLLQKGIDIIM